MRGTLPGLRLLAWETSVMTSTDDVTWQVWRLHYEGLSIRAIAKRLGLSRMRVQRIVAAGPPVVGPVVDGDGDADPWTDEELPPALDVEVSDVMLTPPFTLAGLVEVVDNFPARRRDNKPRHALQWRDAAGHEFGEVELCLWRAHREAGCLPGDFGDRETYLAAWDATTAEVDAATRHAWGQVEAAGLARDEEGRWRQHPRAV
jgi:hypothetical protein